MIATRFVMFECPWRAKHGPERGVKTRISARADGVVKAPDIVRAWTRKP